METIRASPQFASVPIIYVASGNLTSTSLFSTAATTLTPPIPVITKHDLLEGDDAAALAELSWDQQALVDYLVLLRSSFFMGMAESSFAWAVAVRRRVTSEHGTCGVRTGLWSGYLWGSALRDEFSDVMGPHPFGWEINMWP
jgi:hypothetical protein